MSPYLTTLKAARIWEKAEKVEGYNPNIWRKDFAGAWIRKHDYGQRTMYGWSIDTICPLSCGGKMNIDNLMPIHWRNNICKADNYPSFKSCITSKDNKNIFLVQEWQII